MAKFLDRRGVSYHLGEIIKKAQQRLYLISPFLKVSKDLKELLETKRPSVDIRVIFGKSELQPDESEWLEGLDFVKTSYRENLHAKCYLNEDEALLTSMNLYEFSERNNDEMGILVSRKDDEELYEDILKESQRLLDNSQQIRVTVARVEPAEDGREQSKTEADQTAAKTPETGFCLRCGESIPANAAQPYCRRCYRSWNRYKNDTYEEKHCHTCGKEHEAKMSKPCCPDCYRKYKDWVVAATTG